MQNNIISPQCQLIISFFQAGKTKLNSFLTKIAKKYQLNVEITTFLMKVPQI